MSAEQEMVADVDIDLDELVKEFEAGKLNHLLKTEKKVKPKHTKGTKIKSAKESKAVFYINRVTCKKCGAVHQYCVGQGVKDIYTDKAITTGTTDANRSRILQLIAEKRTERFFTDVQAEFCQACSSFLTTEKEEEQ